MPIQGSLSFEDLSCVCLWFHFIIPPQKRRPSSIGRSFLLPLFPIGTLFSKILCDARNASFWGICSPARDAFFGFKDTLIRKFWTQLLEHPFSKNGHLCFFRERSLVVQVCHLSHFDSIQVPPTQHRLYVVFLFPSSLP